MKTLAILSFALLALTGCATPSGDTAQDVTMGTVESVREVALESERRGGGSVTPSIGIGIGGFGGGRVSVGGMVGMVFSGNGSREPDTQPGLEITVKLDDGRTIAVTQAADESFQTGDRVKVYSGNGPTRVSH